MIDKSLEGTGILKGLGLSNRQAWVYLALLRSGDSKGRIIASIAGVPRQEVYGLLAELQQMGLVQKKLTYPVSYAATPFADAVRLLFEAKASELAMMSQKAERVTEKFTQKLQTLTMPKPQLPCFGVVSEGEHGKRLAAAFQDAKGCVDLVSGWARFRQLCYHFEGEFAEAIGRGVHVRVVVEVLSRHYLPKWVSALDTPLFELRRMTVPPAVAFTVFDGAEVTVAFDPSARLLRGPDLWRRHAGLIATCRGYFERQWATAK